MAALAVIAGAARVSWPAVKALVYEQRIREGTNPQGNLDEMAKLDSPFAAAILEKRVWNPEPGLRRNQALSLLRFRCPESTLVRGMKEYDAISQGSYLYGFYSWGYEFEVRSQLQSASARDLRRWLDTYPRHPGRDDACLRLGISLCDDDPIEALRVLHQGLHEPDGDKKRLIANWFQAVLERCATADQLVAWLQGDCPEHAREDVRYVLGVKRLREHRYSEALGHFEEWRASPQSGASELAGRWWNAPQPGRDLKAIDGQIETCRWLAATERAVASAVDAESRAASLQAMGRRMFQEEDLFFNHCYCKYAEMRRITPRVGSRNGGPAGGSVALELEDLHPANHYRQAAEIFRRIVRDFPAYSRIEEVEYSIPLCFWRTTAGSHRWCSHEAGTAIYEGFQAFADRHPRSTMADEALYLAGVHHWLAGDCRDSSVIRRNMARIVAEHPGGNVVVEYATANRWLEKAIWARRYEDLAPDDAREVEGVAVDGAAGAVAPTSSAAR